MMMSIEENLLFGKCKCMGILIQFVAAVKPLNPAYPKLIDYNGLQKGGHFAAWEQTDIYEPGACEKTTSVSSP
jgi:hypothetical protein